LFAEAFEKGLLSDAVTIPSDFLPTLTVTKKKSMSAWGFLRSASRDREIGRRKCRKFRKCEQTEFLYKRAALKWAPWSEEVISSPLRTSIFLHLATSRGHPGC
jgi:hypothetical protein